MQDQTFKPIFLLNILIGLLTFLLFMFFVACGTESTSSILRTTSTPPATKTLPRPTPTPVSSSDLGQRNWLKGIPCHPPCFGEVTPGVTTADDAEKILNQNPMVEPTSVRIWPNYSKEKGAISWNWKGTTSKTDDDGYLLFMKVAPKTVDQIVIKLNNKVKLGDVVDTFSEPSVTVHGGKNKFKFGVKKGQGGQTMRV